MIVYPAMDLMAGRVVRLAQGRFDRRVDYPEGPAAALQRFAEAGAEWAHVVDLDGARARQPVQHELIGTLAKTAPLRIQAAGGLRTHEQAARLLDGGVARVVVGSLAVSAPDIVREWLAAFGAERVALALDVRLVDSEPIVATAGWTEGSGRTLWDVAADFPEARHLLVTDIDRDGMLQGPNFALLEEVTRRLPHLAVQASGGVASLDDISRLATAGVIVGKALWEGRIGLEEAIDAGR
jgi:phosphoribosylformimino-5-aminoimidazole carboxamide ribotide isomerase